MKKFIIATAIVLGTGILASCSRQNNEKVQTANESGYYADRKDISSAD